MGEVIRNNAGADAILADVKTTFERAVKREGVWKEEAEKRFAATLAVVAGIETQLKAAKELLPPAEADAELADERADDLMHSINDEIFNSLGRPRSDPMLQVIFPDGVGGLVNADREGQPERMELVAKLFEGKFHPRIDARVSENYAVAIREHAKSLREANTALNTPRVEIRQLERVKSALARTARVELGRFKRHLLSQGFSEADVHAVIPDRPTAKKKDDGEKAA